MRRRFLVVLATALLAVSPTLAKSNFKILHSFAGKPDGGGVFAGLVLDAKGNLYGVTIGGGAYGEGTVFKLAPRAGGKWSEKILHSFCKGGGRCSDGSLPQSTPVLDSAGDVYGSSNIAIFQLSPGSASATGWSFQVIYNSGSDGLLLDSAGNLYGEWGPGAYGKGDVFELSPGAGGWTENVLYSFCARDGCPDGDVPEFGLAWDGSGNLYGVTTGGGAYNAGVAFQLEYQEGAWEENVLHSFRGSQSDGYAPYAGPIVDQAGNVYGTTLQGGGGAGCGPTGCGSVYRLSKGTDGRWTETILYNFPHYPKNGGGPAAGLVLDKAGNLYGTTTGGGDANCSCGVVFKLAPETGGKWKYTVMHRFTGADGWVPQASLIFDKGYKHLYGTTTEGGPGNYGVVFEITP